MDNPYDPPQTLSSPGDVAVDGAGKVLASRWTRLFASIIDSLIIGGINWLIILVVLNYKLNEISKMGFSTQLLLAMIGVVMFVAINGYFLARSGQTVGKKLLGIRIVTIDGNTPRLLPLIALRYAPLWAASLLPFAGGILNLIDSVCIFKKDKRCVHDLLAGTVVVKN